MTLDLEKFISNSIKTQAKIQHLSVNTKTVKKVPEAVKKLITADYGDNYLLDADYVSFFWGDLTKDTIKSLFNVVDKALGQSANRLTQTDFKKMSFKSATDELDDSSDQDEDVESEEEVEVGIEDVSNEESGEELNEDSEELNGKTSYFFLKITLK